MKTFYIIILTCLCLSSCHTDDGRIYIYKLRNTSGIGINIIAYSKSNEFREPTITNIDDGEEIIKHYKSDSHLEPNVYNFVSFFQGDSIIVTYGNEKQEIFEEEFCEGSERNPLNLCIYSDQEETFTFTQEDYQNANPCNGDCN